MMQHGAGKLYECTHALVAKSDAKSPLAPCLQTTVGLQTTPLQAQSNGDPDLG